MKNSEPIIKKMIIPVIISENDELNYIIEETDGHFNSYGDLVTTVVEES